MTLNEMNLLTPANYLQMPTNFFQPQNIMDNQLYRCLSIIYFKRENICWFLQMICRHQQIIPQKVSKLIILIT